MLPLINIFLTKLRKKKEEEELKMFLETLEVHAHHTAKKKAKMTTFILFFIVCRTLVF